jgi:hypothetical protein
VRMPARPGARVALGIRLRHRPRLLNLRPALGPNERLVQDPRLR